MCGTEDRSGKTSIVEEDKVTENEEAKRREEKKGLEENRGSVRARMRRGVATVRETVRNMVLNTTVEPLLIMQTLASTAEKVGNRTRLFVSQLIERVHIIITLLLSNATKYYEYEKLVLENTVV